ncbi:Uncharacterized protein C1orf112, partial [Colius striatus]
NTALSVLLAACSFAGDTLEAELQASVLAVVGQFWTFLQAKQQLPDGLWIRQVQPLRSLIFLLHVTHVTCFRRSLNYLLLIHTSYKCGLLNVLPLFLFQRQVVPHLSCLFAALLSDQTWLIHQHALEAFTHFAEETSHEDVVPRCLNSEETKKKVVSFLSKTRQVEETTEARRERMKQERIPCSTQLMKMDGELEAAGEVFSHVCFHLQPLAKRACPPPSEEQYKAAVGTMEGALEAVKLLLQKGSAPAWLAEKLEALHAAIGVLRGSV